jgi:hypothetical protein
MKKNKKLHIKKDEDTCIKVVLKSEKFVKDGEILRGNACEIFQKISRKY